MAVAGLRGSIPPLPPLLLLAPHAPPRASAVIAPTGPDRTAPTTGRADGRGRGDRVPGGEDERAVGRDRYGVLDVDAPRPVHRPDRPAVAVDDDLRAARQKPGLDRDDEPGPQCEAAPRDPVVRDLRRPVHHPPDPVPTERGVDLVARAPDHAADGRRDFAQPVAWLRGGDPRGERPLRGLDLAQVLVAWRPDRNRDRGV